MKSKIVFLVLLFACAYAVPKVPAPVRLGDDVINYEPITLHLTPKQVHLKAVGHEENNADEYLIKELSALEIAQRNFIVDLITNALEDFRDIVINGSEDLPPLDPLQINQLGPFSFAVTGISATATIKNVDASGLRWFVVDNVSFNALRLGIGVHLTLPWLTISGSYDASARLAILITHTAGGNFRVFVNRAELGVDIRLGTNILGGHLTLRELDITIDIHDTVIQIDGMVGSSIINNFINSIVQSISHDVIQSQMQNVADMISDALFDTVNEILRDYTLADILG